MSEFTATLQREKLVISDEGAENLVAMSNRLKLLLATFNGNLSQEIVIRGQNMHSTVRMGALMARHFYEVGPLETNKRSYKLYKKMFDTVVKGFEKAWNPDFWIAVYYEGKLLFEAHIGDNHTGDEEVDRAPRESRHVFLDVIEQYDAMNHDSYEDSFEMAKAAFKEAGKKIEIEHYTDIALLVSVKPESGRVGAMIRRPDKKATFSYTAANVEGRMVRVSEMLGSAAAFLDGFQLAFMSALSKVKVQFDLIEEYCAEARRGLEAGRKLANINYAINQFENTLKVVYRPERPDFKIILEEAEAFANKILKKEIQEKIASVDLDEDWIE